MIFDRVMTENDDEYVDDDENDDVDENDIDDENDNRWSRLEKHTFESVLHNARLSFSKICDHR